MICPKCGYEPTLNEIGEHPGKCPACGVFYAKVAKPEASIDVPRNYAPSPGRRDPRIYVVVALFVGLIFGYFAGREHIKYEFRSALQSSFGGLSKAFGGNTAPKPSESKPTAVPEVPKVVEVKLLDKGFRKDEYQEFIEFGISISNLTGKPIRAFDGKIEFTDLLGNALLISNISINDPLAGNDTVRWDGQIKYNQFIDAHTRFKNAEPQNIKVKFTVGKVLYQDGTLVQ